MDEHKNESPTAGAEMEMVDSPVPDLLKEPLSVDTSDTVSLDSDKLRYIPGSNSSSASSPAKESSGSTTPTGKVSPPTTPTSTPQEGDQSESSPLEPVTPTCSHSASGELGVGRHGRPNRPGITWRINGKVEAMDFQKKWYPARIVDIDDKDSTALIHFDGWNQRYDEWMDMKSERIRPLQRHSGRKEKSSSSKIKNANKHEKMVSYPSAVDHTLGDNVFAKWTDCRMYAGTIVGVNPNGSYEVLFYDGFKKSVQPINVKTMSLEVQKEYAEAGILPDPNKRPRQKLHMVSRLEQDAQSEEEDRLPSHSATTASADTKPDTGPGTPATGKFHQKFSEKARRRSKLEPGELGEPEPSTTSPPVTTPPKKKSKLLIGGNFQIKKVKSHTGKPVFRNRDLKQHSVHQKDRGIPGQPEHRKKQVLGLKPTRPTPASRLSSSKSRPKVKNTARRQHKPKQGKDTNRSLPDHSPGDTHTPGGTEGRSENLEPGFDIAVPVYAGSDDSSDEDVSLANLATQKRPGGGATDPAASTSMQEPSKAFKVVEEHNKCKCPFENCNKSFRKMSLVEYHIKYYHTEGEKPPHTALSRKRKKTLSVCSSDSEISAGGRVHPAVPSQKRRKDTASSTSLELASDPPGLSTLEDVMLHDLSEVETHTTTTTTDEQEQREQTLTEDGLDMSDILMDRLNKDELVNCICQINEENGLMIQCDVCLCWQHAVCMELTEETLPCNKYTCFVCANPPGVRDSARYRHDQDWLKEGTMSQFSFLPPDPYMPQKSQIMQATHSLVGDVLGVQKVLRSCNCQVDVLQDKSHPEVKFWYKNWDKIIAEEKRKAEQKRLKSEDREVKGHSEAKQDTSVADGNLAAQTTDVTPTAEIKTEVKTEVDTEVSDVTSAAASSTQGDVTGSQGLTDPVTMVMSHEAGLKTNESSSSLSSLRSTTSEEGLQATAAATKTSSEPVAVVTVKSEEPFASCEENLLHHISSMQDNVESRLELIEEQITALECADDSANNHSGGDVLRDIPRVKKAIHQILNDLVHVKHMSLYH